MAYTYHDSMFNFELFYKNKTLLILNNMIDEYYPSWKINVIYSEFLLTYEQVYLLVQTL